MTRYRCVLIDLDGTLVDSSRGIISCLQIALREFGVRKSDEDLRAALGPPFGTTFEGFAMAPEEIKACIARYRELYEAGPMYDASVYPSTTETLAALNAAGITCAVATSKAAKFARPIVEHFGLQRYVVDVFGPDLDGTNAHKHELISLALKTLVVEPHDTVMIGDRDVDVIGATACDVDSIGALWGFGSAEELAGVNPTHTAQNWDEVLRLCLGCPDLFKH